MKVTEVGTPGSDDAFKVLDKGAGRIADLPHHHRALLDGPLPAIMSTLNASGSVQLSPVWLLHDGDNLLVNSVRGRLKDRNLRARPQVSICVVDPENQYHYISIRGHVSDVVDEDDAERGRRATEVINEMAKLYMGVDEYPLRAPGGEVRSLFTITPDRLSTFN
ncbi:PPOX class F420-dependent oxidoreductase [Streptomyces canus]|uniref:PPOX class F420-dependent oxidoreductase n=1 Tax=Streptomyces canus TaxID=58343 RepID=UPI0037184494